MRIAVFLLLFFFSMVNFIIGLMMTHALPQNHIIEGPVIAFAPFMIAALVLVLSIFALITYRNQKPPPLNEPGMSRWFWLFAGVSIFFSGWWVSMLALYVPDFFGSPKAMPRDAVTISLITAVTVSVVLYFTSNMNSTRRPNLIRYLVLIFAAGAFFMNISFCLVLLFAAPVQPPTTFPFLAGIESLTCLPISLLVFMLARNHFSIR